MLVRSCQSVAILYAVTVPVWRTSDWLQCMQGMIDAPLVVASNQISYALACADRHTGPCTTYISLTTHSVRHSLFNTLGQPQAFSSPSILANVVCLELMLPNYEDGIDVDNIRQFASGLLHRLPNLIAARLWYGAFFEVPYMPLLQLKHLDLGLENLDTLDGKPFAAVLPALETASISAFQPSAISELDVSGCQHLMRLVLSNLMVCRLSKPPQCRLRVDTTGWSYTDAEASQLQPGLSEVNEALVSSEEFYSPQGLVASVCMPNMEVIRCDWSDDNYYDGDDKDDGSVANALMHCLRHSRNLPVLKSILCGDYDNSPKTVMGARIPADLAGVKELMVATNRPLQLVFDSARTAGERLDTFCAVASEVRVDAAALLDMTDALLRRGLTLNMAQAGQEHENAPSQCMYVCAISAPQLSYDDVC